MAVRANDVALRDFFEQLRSILEPSASGTQIEALLAGVAVIEVHLMPGGPAATVGAGHFPKLPEELDRRELSATNPFDLKLAIRRVASDVVRPQITTFDHEPV